MIFKASGEEFTVDIEHGDAKGDQLTFEVPSRRKRTELVKLVSARLKGTDSAASVIGLQHEPIKETEFETFAEFCCVRAPKGWLVETQEELDGEERPKNGKGTKLEYLTPSGRYVQTRDSEDRLVLDVNKVPDETWDKVEDAFIQNLRRFRNRYGTPEVGGAAGESKSLGDTPEGEASTTTG